jgi:hypothetical protein
MPRKIHKPADWESGTFEELLEIEAGQAYVANQLGGDVSPVAVFKSSRENMDTASYELFADNSLWFINNARDEVWSDAGDFAQQLDFDGVFWEDIPERNELGNAGMLVDEMDKNLLIHLWGEELAKEFFERAGGIV